MKETFQLTFHGGAGTVTGANFLLEGGGVKLLVDCGLFQGCKFCEDINHEPFDYDPQSIDLLFVTHAHLDHIGRIPKLVRDGFAGTIYSTPSTKELSEISLVDSIGILEREARRNGKKPLYEAEDVKKALSLWKTVPYHSPLNVKENYTVELKDAGHILGSAMVEVSFFGKKIVFTGDLGNSPAPLLRDTESITGATYLVMESVYGDRNHETVENRRELLEDIIEGAFKKGGALMIPSFSIERTQVLLYEIERLIKEKQIPRVPVFLDSPLAIKATEIYRNRVKNFNKTAQEDLGSTGEVFAFPGLKFTDSVEDSKAIAGVPNPKIIIAGSGMSNGGRILHHERRYLPDPNSTILLVGYQAAGSLGREIADGAKKVTIFDDEVVVRATVANIRGYSAHKDADHLFEFVSQSADTLKDVFVTMGEPKASLALVQRIRDHFGVHAISPKQDDSFELSF